jgi:PAS domain S-box-containing protein
MTPDYQSQKDITGLRQVEQELRLRLTQQEAVARLGQQALHSTEIEPFFQEAANQVVQILAADYCEILELPPDTDQLILRAGVGWQPGYVGQALLEAGFGSQGGFTIQAGVPVIVEDLPAEKRFSPPVLLLDHGVISGMTVIIPGVEQPYGILGVHTRSRRVFSHHDANFLQNVANLLASAITRLAIEQQMRTNRDQLAVVLEGIDEGITVQDRLGRLVFANDQAAQLSGFTNRVELLDTPVSEIMQKFEILDEHGTALQLERLPGRRALLGEKNVSEIVRFRIVETGEEHWSMVRASPVFGPTGQVEFAVNIFQDITDLKRSEQTKGFLAELGERFASTMDYNVILDEITRMVVANLADWCAVYLLETGKISIQMTVAHSNPEKLAWARKLQENYPPDPETDKGLYQVLHSGEPQYYPEISAAMLEASARDEQHLNILRSLGLCSAMILPMQARGHTLGAITLVWAESNRRFGEREIYLGNELAWRAALAIDNVRLYQEASTLNAELETKVTRRTAQLERMIENLRAEISQRQQAEKELVKNETLFSELFEVSPDAIFLVDQDGLIVRYNAQVKEMFGYGRAELAGQPIEMLLPERFRSRHVQYRDAYQKSPRIRSMGADLELFGRRKNGDEFPVDVTLGPVNIEDDWLVICAVRDITMQKRIQAELAEVQHRLMDSQEAERLVLAQELHDTTIQELFSISFHLDELKRDISNANLNIMEKELHESEEMIQRAIFGLRNICSELRPPTLTPFGLEQAILSHLERFQELHPEITVHKELTQDGQLLNERLRLSLFRIYQHAVSNVARHAQAKQLWVRMSLDSEQVTLEIQDDGIGFVLPSRWVDLARQGHLGLVGTRERVNAIGGKLAIISTPGKGLLLRVTAPLESK